MWITQLFSHWSRQLFAPGTRLRQKYQYFRDLLALDRYCLEKMAEIEEIHYRGLSCDYARVVRLCNELDRGVSRLVKSLIALNPLRYRALKEYHSRISSDLGSALRTDRPQTGPPFVLSLDNEAEESLAGGKARNLSMIKAWGVAAPNGFCVTTRAYNAIIEANALRPVINDILGGICLESVEDLENRCTDIRDRIMDAAIPEEIQQEVDAQMAKLSASRLAVRSSAVGEDGALSFAGQHTSVLKVKPENFAGAYKQVLAGKYTPRAVTYRIQAGLADENLPMAALVLEMVDAGESGVVYSSGIRNPDEMEVYAVQGLGEKLVGGEVKPRQYVIGKQSGPGTAEDTPPYLDALFRHSLDLEKRFGKPQDIEWAVDRAGNLLFLQARPLGALKPVKDAPRPELPVLATGQWAASGLASGKIFLVRSHDDIPGIPKGCILVTKGLYPELTSAIGVLGGVIAVEGSAASHFATIARENALPVVINVTGAMEAFQNGQPVTVDGNHGVVHDGMADLSKLNPVRKQTWFTEKMNAVLKTVSRLNLNDAASEAFAPENCRSMHDLIRYSHEMGVREMFDLADRRGRGLQQSKVLDLDVPLSFRVLKLEDGLTESGDARKRITIDDVSCRPFIALFSGLTHEKVEWDQAVKHFDWEEFDKVSAGIFNPEKSSLLSSYGLLAGDYMHVLVRFGYHFTVVDTLAGKTPEQNYIRFSFKGGGAGDDQKAMRLDVIRRVLEKQGFNIDVRSDLLEADFSRKNQKDTERMLQVVGYILGRTRLMDMHMKTDTVDRTAGTLMGEVDAILAL